MPKLHAFPLAKGFTPLEPECLVAGRSDNKCRNGIEPVAEVTHRVLTGFTIGEVVLSGFMLTVGIVATLTLLSFSFRTVNETQDLIVASELAQEGVELARNVRDQALVDKAALGSPADVFVNFPVSGPNNNCIIDYTLTSFTCGSPNTALRLDNGLFRHGAGAGKFYRLLKIDRSGPSDTARVKSFVAWQNPGNNLNGAAGAVNWCTLPNKCVYTEIFLTEWQ